MVSTQKDPVLAVVSLSGGNDGLNTVIPYNDPNYRDYRPALGIPEDQIVHITDELGLHPSFAPLKKYWDEGKLAIIQGVGYPNGSLSHFRSMDIWATCEPDTLGVEGWLGRVIKAIDPNGENVLTGVNFGRGLPRSLAMEGVAVASVGDLNNYGLLTDIEETSQRDQALDLFGRMYSPVLGRGFVNDYIRRTGLGYAVDFGAPCPDENGVAVDRHRPPEATGPLIGSRQRRLTGPLHRARIVTEDVCRADARTYIVTAHHKQIPAECDRMPEVILKFGLRSA